MIHIITPSLDYLVNFDLLVNQVKCFNVSTTNKNSLKSSKVPSHQIRNVILKLRRLVLLIPNLLSLFGRLQSWVILLNVPLRALKPLHFYFKLRGGGFSFDSLLLYEVLGSPAGARILHIFLIYLKNNALEGSNK